MKALSFILITLIVIVGLTFLFGVRKGPEVSASFSANFEYSSEYLFEFITYIEKYLHRKPGLEKIEVTERQGNLIIEWREVYIGGAWQDIKIIKKIPTQVFEIEIVDSSSGYSGIVKYDLTEKDGFTEILLTESGNIPKRLERGMRFLRGDDSLLEAEIKWLRVAIQKELLNRP